MSSPGVPPQQGDAGFATGSQHADADSSTVASVHPPSSDQESQPAESLLGLKVSDSDTDELFDISPSTALSMFCAHVSDIARSTDSVPPAPLTKAASHPDSQTERTADHEESDGAPSKATELRCIQTRGLTVEGSLQDTIQQTALAKKFFSKKAPAISLEEYLSRIQRYCPMSTAVYLAASLYITRLVTIEKIIFVTPRNIHRLVLASLRVAMKALEDLSYPHSRFARVGGVSERELSRLEISFCFLTDFELKVDAHMLMNEVRSIRKGRASQDTPSSDSSRNKSSIPAATAAS